MGDQWRVMSWGRTLLNHARPHRRLWGIGWVDKWIVGYSLLDAWPWLQEAGSWQLAPDFLLLSPSSSLSVFV
jgi:hypothetical protein